MSGAASYLSIAGYHLSDAGRHLSDAGRHLSSAGIHLTYKKNYLPGAGGHHVIAGSQLLVAGSIFNKLERFLNDTGIYQGKFISHSAGGICVHKKSRKNLDIGLLFYILALEC